MMGSVDVIVPCYRYGHFLRECVQSVLTQSIEQLRVLIIDDSSPDNTAEIGSALAHEDSRVTFLRHDVNKGAVATFNEGIDWAAADYMLIVSADDYLLPGALERAAGLLDAHPQVGLVFGKAIQLNADGTGHIFGDIGFGSHQYSTKILNGSQFVESSGSMCIVPAAAAVVRTALQKEIGDYREELPHAHDMEMWLRIAAHAEVGAINTLQAVYRKHGGNLSSTFYREHYLSDLKFRKLAIDYFFSNYGHLLEKPDQLHYRIRREFSYEGIEHGLLAFDGGSPDTARLLLEFATNSFPRVRMTPPWMKLAVRMRIGQEIWRAMHPTLKKIRRVATRRK